MSVDKKLSLDLFFIAKYQTLVDPSSARPASGAVCSQDQAASEAQAISDDDSGQHGAWHQGDPVMPDGRPRRPMCAM